MGGLDTRRVQPQDALGLVVIDGHPVEGQKPRDDVHVADERDVAQQGRRGAQQGRDHRLGHEVLRTAHRDLAVERRPPRTWSNPSTIKYLRNDDVVAGTADAYERAR